jgi:hypothetical protein
MQFPNWYTWLIATLLVGFVVRMLYGIFFSSTEERVRAFLTKTSNARRTRRQEKLLLQAIQGMANISDSAGIVSAVYFALLILGLLLFGIGVVIENDNHKILEQLWSQGGGPPKVVSNIEDLQAELHLNQVVNWVIRGATVLIMSIVIFTQTYVVNLVRARRELTVRLARMKQALFALAPPEQIKSLAKFEALVETTSGATTYLFYAITVAIDLSIAEVTDPIDMFGLREMIETQRAQKP